jgi:type I restriction enzyme S subunit
VPSLPTHWSSARLRWIAGRYAGGTPDKNKDVYWEDGTVPWLNSGAVNQGLVQEPSAFITEEALANSSARWVPAGALLMALAGQGKTKGMVAQLGFRATCNQSMAAVVPGDELAARYLLWWLSANYQNIRNMSGGDNRDGLNLELLGDIPCPLPPIREQAAIAAFLDRETAKIDALVEQQRRLIELLKEKRQAVVSHAATKGLDPNVPMKDSDVEWLGEVPAHWGVVQSRRLFAVRSEPALESDKMLTASQKYGVIFQSDFVELEGRRVVEVILGKANLKHVEPNDFIISMRSFQGGLEWSRLRGSTSFHYVMIKPQKWVHPPYYAHLFKSMNYIQALRATTDLIRDGQELRYSNFTQVPLPVVPVEEQKLIAIYVDRTVEKLGRLSAEAAKSIELMQEHRAALISAAVTGKIDVRENAKVLPFPTDRSRARSLVAAEIIERSAHQATFGRVKLQKIAFLAETHLGIGELAGSYTREAAGPLDRALITEMENGARSMSGATVDQSGGAGTVVSYRLGQQLGAHRHELADWLGEGRIARLDRLIADFASLSTKGAEAVATLYAVWNDALIEGASPTDEEIIAAFLNDWHPEKREKFRADELPAWLDWMRRHGIVPTGNGPKTSTGRLLV